MKAAVRPIADARHVTMHHLTVVHAAVAHPTSNNNPSNLRSADRNRNETDNRNNNNGFRVPARLQAGNRRGHDRRGAREGAFS